MGRVDRFGSQISRRLGAYRPAADPRGAPRLQVEFPYLDGTLDAPQVTRVILAKVRSDLRMDMKRHHEDMGKVSLDDLLDPGADAAPVDVTPMRAVFFPDEGLPRDAEGVHHLELAIKLYLGPEREAGEDAEHWLGPASEDRLGLKLRHLAQHQLPLSAHAAARAALFDLSAAPPQAATW